jgi:hypothetical protein
VDAIMAIEKEEYVGDYDLSKYIEVEEECKRFDSEYHCCPR